MIQNFMPEYLYEKRKDIMSILDAGWAVGRLYRELENMILYESFGISDGITFAFAKAKLKKRLSKDEIMSLVEEFRHDERFGLLVWSIGENETLCNSA